MITRAYVHSNEQEAALVSAVVRHELAYTDKIIVSPFHVTPMPSATCLIKLNKLIVQPVYGDASKLTTQDLPSGLVLQLGQLLYARNGNNNVICARFIGGTYSEPTQHYEKVLGLQRSSASDATAVDDDDELKRKMRQRLRDAQA